MKKITHPLYQNYPEQPYISTQRDIHLWETHPELFPYKLVEKRQMQRLKEGILPGHIIMLWRIHFGNFTNESIIPQYFEYRYGVDSDECLITLIDKDFITTLSAHESLDALNITQLKHILELNHLYLKGKKGILIDGIIENVDEKHLAKQFVLRKYQITKQGEKVLKTHQDIIKKHGPKM